MPAVPGFAGFILRCSDGTSNENNLCRSAWISRLSYGLEMTRAKGISNPDSWIIQIDYAQSTRDELFDATNLHYGQLKYRDRGKQETLSWQE